MTQPWASPPSPTDPPSKSTPHIQEVTCCSLSSKPTSVHCRGKKLGGWRTLEPGLCWGQADETGLRHEQLLVEVEGYSEGVFN
jgi:hypothetical protein